VSRGTWVPDRERQSFRLQDYHLLWLPFPWYSAKIALFDSLAPPGRSQVRSLDPACTTRQGFNMQTVWAVPVSLAATQGIAVAFTSSGY